MLPINQSINQSTIPNNSYDATNPRSCIGARRSRRTRTGASRGSRGGWGSSTMPTGPPSSQPIGPGATLAHLRALTYCTLTCSTLAHTLTYMSMSMNMNSLTLWLVSLWASRRENSVVVDETHLAAFAATVFGGSPRCAVGGATGGSSAAGGGAEAESTRFQHLAPVSVAADAVARALDDGARARGVSRRRRI